MRDTHSTAGVTPSARETMAHARRSRFRWITTFRGRETTREGKLKAAGGIALGLLLSAGIWLGIILLLR